ncbi:hypothetical protein Poli38472_003130 [Pythium oligandrum]|uniref:Uncharacterized protein n=1 Tax=Pythium oligandrum TaxID=41045 RepID=A0A8K1C690_PYTOL|nr:hypothetical protein Poli38472_003130 [Pythium oligandrum]|eukprot:TMW57205.1 hypothetical protein Poli38472_003130 [Pythium oligandrum]
MPAATTDYTAVASPASAAGRSNEPPMASQPSSAARWPFSLFGGANTSQHDDVQGEPVNDPDLEADANQVDVSTKFLCVSREVVEKNLPMVVSISLGAYFGVGMRMLLTEFVHALNGKNAGILYTLGAGFFLPNALGCFVMGCAVRSKPLLRDRFNVIVTGLTTGFCGCCTTFASWDVAVAAYFIHGMWVPAITIIAVQIASALISYHAGFHATEGVLAYVNKQQIPFAKPPVDAKRLQADINRYIESFHAIQTHRFPDGVSRRVTATSEALTTAEDSCHALVQEIAQDEQAQPEHTPNITAWATIGVLMVLWVWIPPFVGFKNYPASRLFGLALGPFGALLRFYLSRYNSLPAHRDFPLYTFIPNVVASIVSCLLIVIGSATVHDDGSVDRVYIFLGEGGLVVGFCGSLSTVSTWVNELDILSSRSRYAAYRYAIISIVVSQLFSIFILGMYAAYGSSPLLV